MTRLKFFGGGRKKRKEEGKERTCSLRVFDIRYEIFVGDVSGRILGVNSDARCIAPCKNGERTARATVEGDAKRFSGCRLQIPRSSR